MTDNTELQRLTRLRRLARQIAGSLPAHPEYLRELPAGAARHMRKPTASKAAFRAELEVALANYPGPATLCPPAAAPEPDRGRELDVVDEDEVGEGVR
jgi:hypothetical protein